MSYEPEIKDTPEDRAAMAILLPFCGEDLGQPWNEVDSAPMDAGWFKLARMLVAAPDSKIDEVLAAIEAVRVKKGGSNIEKLGVTRAEDLMALIVDWRHRRWMDNELREGREPNRLARPDV